MLKGKPRKQARVGFEYLDRKVFDPEKVYGKIAKSGLKFARLTLLKSARCAACSTFTSIYSADYTTLRGRFDKRIFRKADSDSQTVCI